ncbi:hypothetical protein SLEP1_g60099, partial [Rubroshorea leprosula]
MFKCVSPLGVLFELTTNVINADERQDK